MRKGVIFLGVAVFVILLVGIFIFSRPGGENFNTQNPEDDGLNESGLVGEDEGMNSTPDLTIPEDPQTYELDIENFVFEPFELKIKVGDTVIWTNRDSVAHTVTSDSGTLLDSPYLSKDGQYSHTFTEEGIFSYHCKPHPNMKGRIIVE